MTTVQMRPTFSITTNQSTEEAMSCIQGLGAIQSDSGDTAQPEFQGQFKRDHAVISIQPSQRHFWSPWMHLEVRPNNDSSEILGRFSPHPSIWTGFIFSYLAIGVLVFFASLFGVSQQLSSQTPWAYLFVPMGLLIALLLWVASKAGQRMAHDQMRRMKSELEKQLGREPTDH